MCRCLIVPQNISCFAASLCFSNSAMKIFSFWECCTFLRKEKMFDVKKRRVKDFYTNIETKLQQKAEIRKKFSSRISKRKKTTEKKPKCLTTTLGTSISAMFSSRFSFEEQSYKNHNGIYRTHTTSGDWKYLGLMGFELEIICDLERRSNIAWNIFPLSPIADPRASIARMNGERIEKKRSSRFTSKHLPTKTAEHEKYVNTDTSRSCLKLWNFHVGVGS